MGIKVDSSVALPRFVITSASGPLCNFQVLIKKPPLLEDHTAHHRVISILFADSLLNFISLSPKAIFTWDGSTGSKLFEWYSEKEGVAMIFDDRERKLIVGYSDGFVKVLNVANGAILKTLCPVDEDTGQVYCVDIVSMAFAPELRYVCALYTDGNVLFFNENAVDGMLYPLSVTRLPFEPFSCTSLDHVYDSHVSSLPFFVVGTTCGKVYGFDSLSFKILNKGLPLLQHPGGLTVMEYVETGLLLTGDTHGNLLISHVRGARDATPIAPF
ncbi:hypothetical protein GEMRC1_006655 [Eukaryota sp. GEM-RC1]